MSINHILENAKIRLLDAEETQQLLTAPDSAWLAMRKPDNGLPLLSRVLLSERTLQSLIQHPENERILDRLLRLPSTIWTTRATKGPYIGTTPLYWLCHTPLGRSLIANNIKIADFLITLPIEIWGWPATGSSEPNTSPLFLLWSAPQSETLASHNYLLHDYLVTTKLEDAWLRKVTLADGIEKVALEYLCCYESLMQLIPQNSKIVEFMLNLRHPSFLQDSFLSTSFLFWMFSTPTGLNSLSLSGTSDYLKSIPNTTWSMTPVAAMQQYLPVYRVFPNLCHPKSLLQQLCSALKGIELLKRNPDLMQHLTHLADEIWLSPLQGNNPFRCLCVQKEGRGLLLNYAEFAARLTRKNPSAWLDPIPQGKNVGQTPFFCLFITYSPLEAKLENNILLTAFLETLPLDIWGASGTGIFTGISPLILLILSPIYNSFLYSNTELVGRLIELADDAWKLTTREKICTAAFLKETPQGKKLLDAIPALAERINSIEDLAPCPQLAEFFKP